jgi:hypothetical protein
MTLSATVTEPKATAHRIKGAALMVGSHQLIHLHHLNERLSISLSRLPSFAEPVVNTVQATIKRDCPTETLCQNDADHQAIEKSLLRKVQHKL